MSQTAFCSCDFRVRHNLPPIWLGKMNVFNKLRVNQELGFIADRFLGVTGKGCIKTRQQDSVLDLQWTPDRVHRLGSIEIHPL